MPAGYAHRGPAHSDTFVAVLPLYDDNPVRRKPVLTWAIIAACLAAYFLWQPSPFGNDVEDVTFNLANASVPCEVVQGRPLDFQEVDATFNRGIQNACDIDGGASPAFEPGKNVWLSVVTSMFLHGSVIHIGGNLLFLWVFGNNVEDVLGKIGYAAFYLVGGVVATLTHVVLNPDSTVPLVGASGAIAAVMGAYLALFPHARVYTVILFLLFVVIPLRAWIVLAAWFVLQFFTDPNEGVAWAAHVGGFAFGFLIGLAARSLRPPAATRVAPAWSRPPSRWG